MSMRPTSEDVALQDHVRNLLYQYSLQHLTIDYASHTQIVAAEVLSENMFCIPTHDPTCLFLPTEPLDDLVRKWKLDSLQEHEAFISLEHEALQHAKRQLRHMGKLRTAAVWQEDEDGFHDRWVLKRPMSPVLTARARLETPKLGLQAAANMVPKTYSQMLQSLGMQPTAVENEQEGPPPDLEAALNNRLPADTATFTAVTETVRRAIGQRKMRGIDQLDNEAVRNFLRADSPPPTIPRLMSPPLFPRDRLPGKSDTDQLLSLPGGLNDMSDIAALMPVAPLKQEEDPYMEHLVVVNGWQAYEIPTSPLLRTPSLGDSSSEVDELFLPSPENSQLFGTTFAAAKMDEYEFPRSERFRGAKIAAPSSTQGQTLSSFLGALLPPVQTQADNARIVTTPKSQPSSPHTTVTMSMLGQPPTALERDEGVDLSRLPGTDEDSKSLGFSDPDLSSLIGGLLGKDTEVDNPQDAILNEKLDEKYCLLMDVPELPPPNQHSRTLFVPRMMSDLFRTSDSPVTVSSKDNKATKDSGGLLRKVKGLRALTLELSWIPFKYGSSIPTDDEVAGVAHADVFRVSLLPFLEVDPSAGLLALESKFQDTLRLTGDLELEDRSAPAMRAFLGDAAAIDHSIRHWDSSAGDIVLTQADRRKAKGLPPEILDDDLGLRHGSKRARLETAEDGVYPFISTQGHYHGEDAFDDSGVVIVESDEFPGSDSVFTNLACDAEGFDGPRMDGDLFHDIDPVHQIGFLSPRPSVSTCYQQSVDQVPASNAHEPAAGVSQDSFEAGISWPVQGTQESIAFLPLSFEAPTMNEMALQPDGLDNRIYALNDAALRRSMATDSLDTDYYEPAQDFDSGFVSQYAGMEERLPQNADHRPGHLTDLTEGTTAAEAAGQRLAHFLQVRGKRFAEGLPTDAVSPDIELQVAPAITDQLPVSRSVPNEVIDTHTLRLPRVFRPPAYMHKYLASMDLIQKRALVAALAQSQVDLVERESLGEVQVVVDTDAAVLLTTLAALPSEVEALTRKISDISWRYTSLLVIFEAYSPSLSYKAKPDSLKTAAYVYSPPVVKAVKKLRRDVSIAQGCGSKSARCNIETAFADTVEETAAFIRVFGEDAERKDTTEGAIWGAREWLDLDEQDGEVDLAGIDGMNAFAASIILCQVNLDGFLDMTSEERLHNFAGLTGAERIVKFNDEFARRSAAMLLPSSPIHSARNEDPNTFP